MSNGRQMARWRGQSANGAAAGAAVAVAPMTAAAAAAISLQYTGSVETLQAKLDAAGVTGVVIPKGIDLPLRTSITAHIAQQVDEGDVVQVDMYVVSNTDFGGTPGVLLERLGVATFSADGDAVIEGVGVDVDFLLQYYPKTVTLSSDLRAEARSKVALDVVSGQTPATLEVTDPGECSALVAIAHQHATLASAAAVSVVWKEWE